MQASSILPRWLIVCALFFVVDGVCATRVAETAVSKRASNLAAGPVEPGIDIAFGGDVLLGADMNAYVARHGADAPLAGVPELGDADLTIVNLETVVANGADAVDTGAIKDAYFLGRPENLGVLVAAGIDVVTTANNHARDFGAAALEEEHRLLEMMEMAHPGSGPTLVRACAPAYLAVRGLRVAVFAFNATDPTYAAGTEGHGTCYVDVGDRDGLTRIFKPAFAQARRNADLILAAPHFRPSFSTVPHSADRDVATQLIDLGADAVLGGGAHELQGIELYRGRPILHNAGSLLFNFSAPDDAAIFLLRASRAGVEAIRTVPLITESNWTRAARPAETDRILTALDQRSRALGTPVSAGTIELHPTFRPPPALTPSKVYRLDPGPAPAPSPEPPPACAVPAVPRGAITSPVQIGPLTLLGAWADPTELRGLGLIWLETYWRLTGETRADLSIVPRATPLFGAHWQGAHEPCYWAWPTSRWKPGIIYRDRYPLRPPFRAGARAVLALTDYGPLAISIEIQDESRSLGESGAVETVVFYPSLRTLLTVSAAAAGILALVALLITRWRRHRNARDEALARSVPGPRGR